MNHWYYIPYTLFIEAEPVSVKLIHWIEWKKTIFAVLQYFLFIVSPFTFSFWLEHEEVEKLKLNWIPEMPETAFIAFCLILSWCTSTFNTTFCYSKIKQLLGMLKTQTELRVSNSEYLRRIMSWKWNTDLHCYWNLWEWR